MANTTPNTALDKFTICEVVFTAGKNAALSLGKRADTKIIVTPVKASWF